MAVDAAQRLTDDGVRATPPAERTRLHRAVGLIVGVAVLGCGPGPAESTVATLTPGEPSASARTPAAPRGPIGGPDEMIVVSTVPDGAPPTLLVELVGAGGARRSIARLPAFGRLPGDVHEPKIGVDPLASDRGFLAVLTGSLDDPSEPATAFVVDLLDPAAMPLRIPAGEGGIAWGPDGRLTVAPNPVGDLDLVDAASGGVRHVRIPDGVEAYPWPTADGSGWYVSQVEPGAPATTGPTGVIDLDGVVRDGPPPPLYGATGVDRLFGPDGERVDAGTGAGGRRIFTVAADGATRDWYSFPDPRDLREFGNGEVRWTADRAGLWVIDEVAGAYRLVRIDSPGAPPNVVATWPYQERPGFAAPAVGFVGISSGDRTVAVARFDVDDATPRLLRIDTATGAVEEIPGPPGSAADATSGLSFAGWASVGDR